MTENMLTIDRLFDFGVLGFLDTCRLSDVGVVRALSRAICDRLSDIGVRRVKSDPTSNRISDFAVLARCLTVVV